jgi:hypothetical protein
VRTGFEFGLIGLAADPPRPDQQNESHQENQQPSIHEPVSNHVM